MPEPCRCSCGYTCGRKCGLDIMDCMAAHYQQDCGHQWDGPTERGEHGGCHWESVTCSRCGLPKMAHDMAAGP